MAKPHRMAALTVTALAALVEALWMESRLAIEIGLWVIAAGTIVTAVRRTLGIAARLRAAWSFVSC